MTFNGHLLIVVFEQSLKTSISKFSGLTAFSNGILETGKVLTSWSVLVQQILLAKYPGVICKILPITVSDSFIHSFSWWRLPCCLLCWWKCQPDVSAYLLHLVSELHSEWNTAMTVMSERVLSTVGNECWWMDVWECLASLSHKQFIKCLKDIQVP